LGSALLRLHEQACTPPPAPTLVKEHLDQAVQGLERVGNRHHLPRALLTRADWHRLNGDLKETQSDLDNAMLASLMGGMTLYQADCHLAYARLHLDRGEPEQARTRLDAVRTLVDKSHCHRLDEQIAALKNELSCMDRMSPASQRPAKGSKRRMKGVITLGTVRRPCRFVLVEDTPPSADSPRRVAEQAGPMSG
jgi:ATP/maltotriose-dependent transcriptional regulator MalT